MGSMKDGVSRRRLGVWWLASAGLMVTGCGGGGLDPLDVVDDPGDNGTDVDPQKDCNDDRVIDLKDDCNNDGKLDDSDKQCCRGGSGSGSGQDGTLYQAYLALRSGMTRAEVIAAVPVSPSQGASTDQVLWVKGDEALGVKFNGSTDASVITFAQWGLSIAAGGRNESRNF
jgi:hypothetical protein